MGSNREIALPKDAEGREIPLNTKGIFDGSGSGWRVGHVEHGPRDHGRGFLVSKGRYRGFLCARYAHLEKPATSDSWEKLLEDLDNAVKGGDSAECRHSRREGVKAGSQRYGCKPCRSDHGSLECEYPAYAGIAARIRKPAAKEGE